MASVEQAAPLDVPWAWAWPPAGSLRCQPCTPVPGHSSFYTRGADPRLVGAPATTVLVYEFQGNVSILLLSWLRFPMELKGRKRCDLP